MTRGMGRVLAALGATVVVTGAALTPTAAATSRGADAGRAGVLLRVPRAPGSRATGLCQACSYNWSGYAQVASRRHTFTEVTDSFVVPTVTASAAGEQMAADWVGIGGWSDGTLVQAGIETDAVTVDGQTSVTYGAWTEVLPQAERPMTMTVEAGDTVTVTIAEVSRNEWRMEVQDGAQIGQRTVRSQARGLSAEAIHERPCIAAHCGDPQSLATLAQTSDVTFGPGSVSETAPGLVPETLPLLGTVPGATLHLVSMVGDDGVTALAVPSAPDAAGVAFTVADGAVAPPAPSDTAA
ncbi:MAG: G1 family glutamic endopeptidase [Acidimicrobiales bacterium]